MGTGTDSKERLDRRTIDAIRRFLEERRQALTRSVQAVIGRPGSIEGGLPTEEAAQATETLLNELDVALVDRQSRQVVQIEAALERLGRREYGLCRDCATFIGLARLKALPFAVRCRPCQDRAEQEERRASTAARGAGLLNPRVEAEVI